jgi:hypothetical protein
MITYLSRLLVRCLAVIATLLLFSASVSAACCAVCNNFECTLLQTNRICRIGQVNDAEYCITQTVNNCYACQFTERKSEATLRMAKAPPELLTVSNVQFDDSWLESISDSAPTSHLPRVLSMFLALANHAGLSHESSFCFSAEGIRDQPYARDYLVAEARGLVTDRPPTWLAENAPASKRLSKKTPAFVDVIFDESSVDSLTVLLRPREDAHAQLGSSDSIRLKLLRRASGDSGRISWILTNAAIVR